MDPSALLALLQLTSPALPIGAYSYSEGLETLVEQGLIRSAEDLKIWLETALATGSISLDLAILVRAYRAWKAHDLDTLTTWNHWLSATRETGELQQQSWQMGRSLLKLLQNLYPAEDWTAWKMDLNWNGAIVFAIAASLGNLDERTAALAYAYSWVSNGVSAGVKLIPLGQTVGQQLTLSLSDAIQSSADRSRLVVDEGLYSCNWGLTLASMAHETQYSRLFRS